MSFFRSINGPTAPQETNFAVSAATPGDRKIPKDLLDARDEFDAYIKQRKASNHFKNVTKRDGPVRRQDWRPHGQTSIPQGQRAFIRENYKWNEMIGRWTLNNGGPIVIEREIHDTILSYQRAMAVHTRDAVFHCMKTRVAGVQQVDVRKAHELWGKYNLGALAKDDDSSWNGKPAATIGEHPPWTTPIPSC